MKNIILASIISISLFSCSADKKEDIKEVTKDSVIELIKQSLVTYIPNPKYSEYENGTIEISGNNEFYSISRDAILIDQLDEDGDLDAFVSVGKSYGGNISDNLNFILLTNGGSPIFLEVLSEVKSLNITKIEDKVIYGTIYSYAQDDPSCCPSIKENKQFKVIANKVVEVL